MNACTLLRSVYVVGLVGVGGSWSDSSISKYKVYGAYKTVSARRGRERFTRAASAAAAGDSWKDSGVSISSAELVVWLYRGTKGHNLIMMMKMAGIRW